MKYAIDETELARLIDLYNKAESEPWNPLDDQYYIDAACNDVPALAAEVRRLREALNKEHRAWQCAEGRGDGLEMENAALRAKVEALQKNYDCEHAALMRHEHMVAELMEKVEAWEWFEECFEAMQWLVPMGPNRGNACEEAVISTLDAQKRAVHADRE